MSEEQKVSFYTNFQNKCNELTSSLLSEVPLSDNEKISISNESDEEGNIINKFYDSNDNIILITKFTHVNIFIYTRKWNN